MSPAEELRAAAFLLRNPIRRPELCGVSDFEFTSPLVKLLEVHADFATLFDRLYRASRGAHPAEGEHTAEVRAALAVARAINGEQQ